MNAEPKTEALSLQYLSISIPPFCIGILYFISQYIILREKKMLHFLSKIVVFKSPYYIGFILHYYILSIISSYYHII